MSVFYLGPTLASLVFSFTDYPIIATPRWAGLKNYRTLLHDPAFLTSLKVTALYTVCALALYVVAGLALALLCNRRVPGIGLVRTIVFLPSLIPVFVMAFLWGWLLNTDFGLVNFLLNALGLPSQGFFQSESQALWLTVVVSFWTLGSAFIVYLAGLQSVPHDLYEAVTVDGGGALRKFWHVTLPMISPIILFNLVIGMILSFQVFDIAWALTKGGPGDSTLFLVLFIWRTAFEQFDMGYASALAWVLFLVIVGITALVFRTARYWVHYESAVR
ncbi:MAG: sugar ABC transporter permease [Actinobacteria bacterium]|nr:sugar ABC transporter permease [Actinomycetota bacterium]